MESIRPTISITNKQIISLIRDYERQSGNPEFAKKAAKDLAWMIPAMAVEGFTLALFVADILMFAVIVRSLSAGVLLGVTVGMVALSVKRGQDYPYPKGLGEVFIGALIAMFFFAVTASLVFWVAPPAVPLSVLIRFVATGVVGLTLTGMAFYFPKWNPQKYTESDCAYYWAVALNSAWTVAWFILMDGGPDVGGASRFDSHSDLSAVLIFVSIIIFVAMFYFRGSKDGINMAKKNDGPAFSLNSRPRQIYDIKRKRVVLYTFKAGVGEAVAFGALAANLLEQAFLKTNFDPLRFDANVVGTLMFFAVWRYIRRANRRADSLLEKQLQTL